MNEFAARIERDFPLRRKEKEKMEFRTWLVHTFKELGYTPKLESGESVLAAGGSMTNVVVGDIDKAKIVLAAHLPDAAADVPALSGALSAFDGGGELFALPCRDVSTESAGHDVATFSAASGRGAFLSEVRP